MAAQGVVGKDQEVLARWMHELGDILYFQDDPELSDMRYGAPASVPAGSLTKSAKALQY